MGIISQKIVWSCLGFFLLLLFSSRKAVFISENKRLLIVMCNISSPGKFSLLYLRKYYYALLCLKRDVSQICSPSRIHIALLPRHKSSFFFFFYKVCILESSFVEEMLQLERNTTSPSLPIKIVVTESIFNLANILGKNYQIQVPKGAVFYFMLH